MSYIKIALLTCSLALLAGCAYQKYRPAPLSPAQTAASLAARTLSDPGLHEFLQNTAPALAGEWPVRQWDLARLTLAAFYFNPELDVARAQLAQAQAAVITAGARLNPGLRGDVGGETAPESPWIAGVGFSLPIETAGKRGHRIDAARQLVDVARWDLAIRAWSVRAQVRSALVALLAARRSVALLQTEEQARAEQAHLLQQRFAVGMISRPELDTVRIQHLQSVLAVRTAEGGVSQARAALAAAIGIPASSLSGANISWPQFDDTPATASLDAAKIQEDAVLNRLDIRRALADYSAAESRLRLEIANQYPNIDLGPDYAFEEATHLFSLAAALTLPVFNRNQGPIAEAVAARQASAARFRSVQAAGVAASEQARAKYAAALAELSQARQIEEQSQMQVRAAEQALKAGQGDRVTLNGAQLQSAVAAAAQFQALVHAQQALGELENAIQHPLLPADIPSLSPQSPALQSAKGK